MTDPLSSLLGGVLLRVLLVGAVVVAMALALRGEWLLAAGLAVPLLGVAYLVLTDAGFLA